MTMWDISPEALRVISRLTEEERAVLIECMENLVDDYRTGDVNCSDLATWDAALCFFALFARDTDKTDEEVVKRIWSKLETRFSWDPAPDWEANMAAEIMRDYSVILIPWVSRGMKDAIGRKE